MGFLPCSASPRKQLWKLHIPGSAVTLWGPPGPPTHCLELTAPVSHLSIAPRVSEKQTVACKPWRGQSVSYYSPICPNTASQLVSTVGQGYFLFTSPACVHTSPRCLGGGNSRSPSWPSLSTSERLSHILESTFQSSGSQDRDHQICPIRAIGRSMMPGHGAQTRSQGPSLGTEALPRGGQLNQDGLTPGSPNAS